jgi:hypothetical protein
MTRLEDKIRDYLASHLDLLEEGFRLVGKEYKLPNQIGAGGRIDIVARDIYGHVVIIEIKRSDQAARQALNEIHKYTALFLNSQGLDESRIRLMVISTDWHELRLPLSEFAETTRYPVEGISITAAQDGMVSTVSKVEMIARPAAFKISRAQGIYLYRTAARRDEELGNLVDAVKKAGVHDFSIFRCDHSASNRRVVFPFGNYLCFSSPSRNLPPVELEQLKGRIAWDDGLDEPDENFIANINACRLNMCEDFESGYPEKLTNLRTGWSVSVSVRSGRLGHKEAVLTDEEIIALAQGVDGGSSIYLGKTSSPRFEAGWKQLREDLAPVLQGNAKWQEVVPRFLDEIETSAPTATVSIFAFNPTNFFLALYWIAWNQDYSKCPHLEIVVEDRPAEQVRILIGYLAWNGQKIETTPDKLMDQIFGDDFGWMAAVTMHTTFEHDDAVLAAHQLTVRTAEWRFQAGEEVGPIEAFVDEGQIGRRPFSHSEYRPFKEFVADHSAYLAALKTYLEGRVAGLPGSSV